MLVASFVLLQAIKWATFENRSTPTNIKSLSCCVLGKPRMVSMLMCTKGWVTTGNVGVSDF